MKISYPYGTIFFYLFNLSQNIRYGAFIFFSYEEV